MQSAALIQYTRYLCGEYLFRDGTIRPIPAGKYLKNFEPTEEENGFLREYVKLIAKDKGYINQETREYLTNPTIYKTDVVKRLYPEGNSVNKYTVMTRIGRGLKVIQESFPEDMLTEVIVHHRGDLDYYMALIERARYSHRVVRTFERLGIDLPEVKASPLNPGKDRMEEFIRGISPYTPEQMKFVAENVDREALAYANYLLIADNVKGEEALGERELLQRMLGKKQ